MTDNTQAPAEAQSPAEVPNRRAGDVPDDAPWWVKMLVPEIREAGKWLSTKFTILAAAAPLLYANVADLQQFISPKTFHYIEAALVLLIFLGRITRQPTKEQQ